MTSGRVLKIILDFVFLNRHIFWNACSVNKKEVVPFVHGGVGCGAVSCPPVAASPLYWRDGSECNILRVIKP